MNAAVRYRRTFYHCICPDPPSEVVDQAYIHWLLQHYKTCKPRRIVDVHLPPYPIEGE